MKCVHVGHHCCIRMVKQYLALLEAGHEVHGIGCNKPTAWELLKTFVLCNSVENIQSAVRLHKDADIFHVHNEPSWLPTAVKEVTSKPVIFDVHDSMEYRDERISSQSEAISFEVCDGVVFVSDRCKDITLKNHDIDKPYIVLPPYANERFIQYRDWMRKGGLLYQGLISTNKSKECMAYADYKKLGEEAKKLGIPFYIYTVGVDDYMKEYYKDSDILGTLTYDKLMKNLGHYDWGLCGNVDSYRDWDVAMPNKLFEYIAGGLPIVAMNCKTVGEFVEEHGIGIAVSSLEELKERWDERDKCAKNLFMKRKLWTMESNIYKLEQLYNEVLNG